MKKRNTILIIIAIITLFSFVAFATYAFFSVGNLNVTNVANLTATSERNNMVFDTLGGAMALNVTVANWTESTAGNVAAQNNTTLTVNFQANTNYSMVCSYDIIYEWTSTDKYQAHSSGVTDNEFTIQASLANNDHVYQGTNHIASETDLTTAVGNQTSATVVQGARIDSTGTTTNSAVWTITSKFYNANAYQDDLTGKSYAGRFKVANVSCSPGTSIRALVDYISNEAPRSGTDAVSNSPWILTEDHSGEWRYAGKNPDNYVQFNGELWRIIGLMPNMTYCTGTYGNTSECDTTATGSLVKIIRNDSLGDFSWDYKQTGVGSSTTTNGSNDWSDSQLMLMLNGANYLFTGYDANNTNLHNDYGVFNGPVTGNNYQFYNASYSYLDGNGTTVYLPASATTTGGYTGTTGTLPKKITSSALSKIATVKWDLYGTKSFTTAAEGSPSVFYNKERNINGLGAVYTNASLIENRAVYWYGKIGLMYPSDFGYASNGDGSISGGESRNVCLGTEMYNWNGTEYCYVNDWMYYVNATASSVGTSATYQWTLSPNSGYASYVFSVVEVGYVGYNGARGTSGVRPVLYLKAETEFSGGNGTYNSPYTIN